MSTSERFESPGDKGPTNGRYLSRWYRSGTCPQGERCPLHNTAHLHDEPLPGGQAKPDPIIKRWHWVVLFVSLAMMVCGNALSAAAAFHRLFS